jgi:hypothetical protein
MLIAISRSRYGELPPGAPGNAAHPGCRSAEAEANPGCSAHECHVDVAMALYEAGEAIQSVAGVWEESAGRGWWCWRGDEGDSRVGER